MAGFICVLQNYRFALQKWARNLTGANAVARSRAWAIDKSGTRPNARHKAE